MSLRKKFKADNAEVDTGPLNDILFILMFFFLIISTLANAFQQFHRIAARIRVAPQLTR